MNPVYLDYGATTPLDQRVITAMQPYFQKHYGNPSSLHRFGQQAKDALEGARKQIASGLGAKPEEIIFTSSGSESDNLALRGTAFEARRARGADHLLISPIEHPAVVSTAKQLAALFDFHISWLEPDRYGVIHAESVAEHLDDRTAIVSVMHANNEVGTLSPIKEIAEICREHQVAFHTDAVQGAAHFPIDLDDLKVDLLSLGAHKFYGPKGVGALFVREGLDLIPSQTGGSQEFGLRAATENIPLIIGMAEAFQLVQEEHQARLTHCQALRDRIISEIQKIIPGCELTGHPQHRLPNHASFLFRGLDGSQLVLLLDQQGFACSSGSACKSGSSRPSAVLSALGYSQAQALGSLRITVGKDTQESDVEAFLSVLPDCVSTLREQA